MQKGSASQSQTGNLISMYFFLNSNRRRLRDREGNYKWILRLGGFVGVSGLGKSGLKMGII